MGDRIESKLTPSGSNRPIQSVESQGCNRKEIIAPEPEGKKIDKFVPDTKPGFSELSDEQKKFYGSVRVIEVKKGEQLTFSFNGKVKNARYEGDGFKLQENAHMNSSYFQTDLNLKNVAHIERVRTTDGKDIYYVGFYKGFNGDMNVKTKSGNIKISTKDEPPPPPLPPKVEEPKVEVPPKPAPPPEPPKPKTPEEKFDAEKPKVEKAQDEETDALAKAARAKGKRMDAENKQAKLITSLFEGDAAIAREAPASGQKILDIKNQLLKAGTIQITNLDNASIKLKMLALEIKNNPKGQKATNAIVDRLRAFSETLKKDPDRNITGKSAVKFGIDERGKDYHYGVKEPKQWEVQQGRMLRVDTSGGPLSGYRSNTQIKLNELMKKANETGKWKDLDKALEYIVQNNLKLYYE